MEQPLRDPNIRLVKPREYQEDLALDLTNLKINELNVGGREGKKHILTFEFNRRGDGETREIDLIAKKVRSGGINNAREHAITYRNLLKLGYPVPPTVRYFEHGGEEYVAMTDMREKGKYRIWGMNDNPSKDESEELSEMAITEQDMVEISRQLDVLVQKASEDGIALRAHNFHIRKDQVTSQINVTLLDINPSEVQSKAPKMSYGEYSNWHKNYFMDKLKGKVARAKMSEEF